MLAICGAGTAEGLRNCIDIVVPEAQASLSHSLPVARRCVNRALHVQ